MNKGRNGLVIATRQSELAMWQARHVQHLLRQTHRNLAVSLLPMTTKGDRILDRSLAAIGGKGLFLKELETALTEGRADLAVHSMKDVRAELPDGLMIGAILAREDRSDALVGNSLTGLGDLPAGAVVGTSSLRRRAQLLALRSDVEVVDLRGNVPTRLKKLEDGACDAAILAVAGLKRLGLARQVAARLECSDFLPAPAQGAIGIECRIDDATTRGLIKPLVDADATITVGAERAFNRELEGSCQVPLAAACSLIDAHTLELEAMVATPDGKRRVHGQRRGPVDAPEALGMALAHELADAGAREILDELEREHDRAR